MPSCMAYVDDGVVFVGSMFGDSQLVKILPERGADGGCLSMLSTEQNIGPIVDFCLVDAEQQGYSHFISCSGAFKVATRSFRQIFCCCVGRHRRHVIFVGLDSENSQIRCRS